MDPQQNLVEKPVPLGADHHADAVPLFPADQGLGVGVGLIVVFLRDGEDLLGQLGVHVSAPVEHPVHRPSGRPRQLRDLFDGYHKYLRLSFLI